jgi:signal peptidase I
MLRAFESGDRLVVEGLSYRFRAPRIGEVVVVRWPSALSRPPDAPQLDLKRIAAAPGLEVEMQGVRQTLGDDEWYVLGDNLGESEDSRMLGPVRTADVVGRVWFRY